MFARIPSSLQNSRRMYARSYILETESRTIMIPGLILIAIGAFLVMRNRWIALRLGVEPQLFHLPFFSSVAVRI
jgi:hypothetical protein